MAAAAAATPATIVTVAEALRVRITASEEIREIATARVATAEAVAATNQQLLKSCKPSRSRWSPTHPPAT